MARPLAPIDEEQVRKLAEKLWSDEQIAAFIGVHRTTLVDRYSQLLKDSRHSGRGKLVDMLWQRAQVSDRLFEHALNRFLGPIPNKIEITKEQAIEVLENELKRHGAGEDSETSDEG